MSDKYERDAEQFLASTLAAAAITVLSGLATFALSGLLFAAALVLLSPPVALLLSSRIHHMPEYLNAGLLCCVSTAFGVGFVRLVSSSFDSRVEFAQGLAEGFAFSLLGIVLFYPLASFLLRD